jgi:hypothetical protein
VSAEEMRGYWKPGVDWGVLLRAIHRAEHPPAPKPKAPDPAPRPPKPKAIERAKRLLDPGRRTG